MVILSWNTQKSRNIPIETVLSNCERWEASVVVIQEPTGAILNFGSKRRATQPRGCNFIWRGYLQQGGSQGSIVILAREGVTIANINAFDTGLGQGTRRITRTNPLVFFDAMEDGERVSIATCHAPYDQSIASQYSRNALEETEKRDTNVLIGDMNTYGTRLASTSRRRPSRYHAPSLGATSNRGKGSPLDKAIVSDSLSGSYLAGRVLPNETRGIKRPRESSDAVKDIIDSEWDSCPSDHLPIFIAFYEQTSRLDKFFNPDKDHDDDDEDRSSYKKPRTGPAPDFNTPDLVSV